ncbi:phage tail tape-measure protein, partial [Pseudomonas aeruginosa]
AQQRAGLLSYADYVARRSELISQNKDQVTAAYEGEIQALEALRDKSSTTAAQRISLDQKIAEARNNMVKAQKKAEGDLEVLQLNEQGRLKKQTQAVKAYSDALQQQQDALAVQGQRAAAAVGMGAQQRRLFDQRGSLDDRFAQQRLDLASQYGDGSRGMSLDEYNDKIKALEANHA